MTIEHILFKLSIIHSTIFISINSFTRKDIILKLSLIFISIFVLQNSIPTLYIVFIRSFVCVIFAFVFSFNIFSISLYEFSFIFPFIYEIRITFFFFLFVFFFLILYSIPMLIVIMKLSLINSFCCNQSSFSLSVTVHKLSFVSPRCLSVLRSIIKNSTTVLFSIFYFSHIKILNLECTILMLFNFCYFHELILCSFINFISLLNKDRIFILYNLSIY